MKKFIIRIYVTGLIFMTSCEGIVEIAPPQDQLISNIVFKNDETAISATTAIYAKMMKSDFPLSYSVPLLTGIYSDELEYSQTSPSLMSLWQYNLLSKDAPTNPIWINGFHHIYQSNLVIEGLRESSEVTEVVRKQLLGEALFIRAFWHYNLTNYYGGVPIVLTTNYMETATLYRSSIESVINQVLLDLLRAKELLSEKYVAGNTITESTQRIRPNSFVVSALLARIYLQIKDYNKADIEATRIIGNSKYSLSDVNFVFKIVSKEVIWQLELPALTNTNNSYEASLFTLTTKPSATSNSRSTTLSESLLSLFSSKDKRRLSWVGTFTDNSVTPAIKYNYPSKFKTRTIPADEYTTPFRLAEMYLIRSETRAINGQLSSAVEDLDKIRGRAGLSLIKDSIPNITQNALLDSISNERRREFFCEWGIRWGDILRSDLFEDLMKKIATKKGVEWRSTSKLWPIPLNEIINSGKYLKQNEGYN